MSLIARSIRAFACVAPILCACSDPAAEGPPDRPHIVLYLVDTLRADRLGCYGNEQGLTPRIDAVAAESAVFSRAISVAPWTVPSVASLLTSTYPSSHGVLSGPHKVAAGLVTLAETLRSGGYHTALFTHSPYGGTATGLERGYEEVFERLPGAAKKEGLRAENQPFLSWIESWRGEEPLFAYIHTVEPHFPLTGRDVVLVDAEERESLVGLNELFTSYRRYTFRSQAHTAIPKRYRALEKARRAKLREIDSKLATQLEAAWAYYDTAVRSADDHLGQVVDALVAKGLWEDTVFVIVSDHGEEFHEHGGWLHDHSLHAELLDVPLLMRVPGRTEDGRRIGTPASLLDVVPTLAELAGVPAIPQWQGQSLLPVIGGGLEQHPVLAERINLDKAVPAVRRERGDSETALVLGRWKLIAHHELETVSLYDLVNDPTESVDLAEQHGDVVAEMTKQIEEWRALQSELDLPSADHKDLNPTQIERLRELGYVESQ